MEDYNILIGLGKALTFDMDNEIMLTPESKATADAAAFFVNSGKLSRLILSGGDTQGSKYLSEAELMQEYIYHNISKSIADFIEIEPKSKTTWSNARNVREMLKGDVNNKMGLLTIGYHLPRAKKIFKREGFSNLIPPASEDYVTGLNLTEISEYLNSSKGVYERTKEMAIRAFTFFFPSGKILENIANNTRSD